LFQWIKWKAAKVRAAPLGEKRGNRGTAGARAKEKGIKVRMSWPRQLIAAQTILGDAAQRLWCHLQVGASLNFSKFSHFSTTLKTALLSHPPFTTFPIAEANESVR